MNDQSKMIDEKAVLGALERKADQGALFADPRAYIQHAAVVLGQLRDRLIKTESLHQSKRASEMVAFKDRIQRLDADHEKTVAELTAMIERLEVFRGMTEFDALLQPFALWLGLGLTKAGLAALGVGLLVIMWRGTTEGGLDD